MSKYQPLADFLNHLKADEWRPTFLELERILGAELPKGARKQEDWWSNEAKGSAKHSQAWLGVGWEAERPDLEKEQVTFRRAGTGGDAAASQAGGDSSNKGGEAKSGDKASQVMKQADKVFERGERAETIKKVGAGAGVAAAAVAVVAGVTALTVRAFRRRK